MSTTNSTCPKCGAPLPANSPAGLCARCLMTMNLATQTVLPEDAGGSSGEPKPAPLAPEEIARHFPGFDILECLGRGGMGVVYKARQKSLNRLVALKILAPEREQDAAFAQRFAVEAGTLARLNHPGVVTIYDFGQADGLFYFVMEFVDGVSLRQLLSNGRVAPREALAIVPAICDALQYAHDAGIVHRDIKPENILLDRRGRVKVADFGLAKLVGGRDASPRRPGDDERTAGPAVPASLTDAGKIMGTPQYMAPEQAEKPGEVDHRADIYALGVVFYQMLTGELPGKPLEPPSRKVHIDVRLDEVVMRALEQDPGRRYSQASALKTQVETILTTPPPSSAGLPPAVPPLSQGEMPVPPTDPRDARVTQPPRFSRLAIVGACSAPAAFLAFIMTFTTSAVPAGEYHGPAGWQYLLMFTLLPLGFTAPFGTTILGWVAVSQIRRSPGKLYGLGLALFDGLLFPLLALDGVIGGLCFVVLKLASLGLPTSNYALHDPRGFDHLMVTILALLTLATSSLVDFLIIRRAWRTVNKPIGGSAQAPASGKPTNLKATEPGPTNVLRPALLTVAWHAVLLLATFGFCVFVVPLVKEGFAALTVPLPVLTRMTLTLSLAISRGGFLLFLVLLALDAGICILTQYLAGRRLRRVWSALVVCGWGVISLAATVSLLSQMSFLARNVSSPQRPQLSRSARLAEAPEQLRALPTAQVIEAGMAKPQLPWAWQELGQRARTGRLTATEADLMLDGLTAWLRRDYPNGYSEPLHWLDGLLEELRKRGLASEAAAVRFLEAFYGNPSCDPLPRLREPAHTLRLTCHWRSAWYQTLLGFVLLNEMHSITIDGQSADWRPSSRRWSWNMNPIYGDLALPELAPGKHTVRCEIVSALVADRDIIGLADQAPSQDWPPAKKRWIRSFQAEFTVSAKDTQIVSLTQDPALDPVTSGALSVKQVVVRRKGDGATAMVLFNINDNLPLPISFDVTLRLGGETYPCGSVWYAKDGNRTSSGANEPAIDLDALDPKVKEAEIILTPNPLPVEPIAAVERIWGKEVRFSHVPLTRYDIQ